VHTPVLEHESPGTHVAHVAPPAPQADVVSAEYGVQVPVTPPLQQPSGHVRLSHQHWPLFVSHTALLQALHAAPAEPHWLALCEAKPTHVAPLQQPPGHAVGSQWHVPLAVLQLSPAPHARHPAPPAPHEVFDWLAYGTQTLPSQQPFGHEVASQTHAPLVVLHSRPDAHARHTTPPAPHDPVDSPERASHVVPLQQPAHADPPQVHVPAVVEHVCPEPHGAHAAPAVPHWAAVSEA
jgi:hypothetical protein